MRVTGMYIVCTLTQVHLLTSGSLYTKSQFFYEDNHHPAPAKETSLQADSVVLCSTQACEALMQESPYNLSIDERAFYNCLQMNCFLYVRLEEDCVECWCDHHLVKYWTCEHIHVYNIHKLMHSDLFVTQFIAAHHSRICSGDRLGFESRSRPFLVFKRRWMSCGTGRAATPSNGRIVCLRHEGHCTRAWPLCRSVILSMQPRQKVCLHGSSLGFSIMSWCMEHTSWSSRRSRMRLPAISDRF